jgi:hypothetical protein
MFSNAMRRWPRAQVTRRPQAHMQTRTHTHMISGRCRHTCKRALTCETQGFELDTTGLRGEGSDVDAI